jgi:hypothetical protein
MPCLCTNLGWVRPNASLRLGYYTWHSSSHGSFEKNFVFGIFGVWIFGLLQEVGTVVAFMETAADGRALRVAATDEWAAACQRYCRTCTPVVPHDRWGWSRLRRGGGTYIPAIACADSLSVCYGVWILVLALICLCMQAWVLLILCSFE